MSRPSDQTVNANGIEYSGSDLEALLCLRRYRQWIIDEIAGHIGGRALEVGVGIGSFSRTFLEHVDHLDMVEPSDALSRTVAANFDGDPRVGIFHGTYESWLEKGATETHDTVVMINVLEHIEDDAAALAGTFRALKPGGTLALFVPALQFLFSPIDAEFGHYRRYHLKALRRLVSDAGFEIHDSHYLDFLGMAPWWLVNKVMKRTDFSPWMAGLYDAVGVPVTRAFERLVRPPLGKNILLIARRPL